MEEPHNSDLSHITCQIQKELRDMETAGKGVLLVDEVWERSINAIDYYVTILDTDNKIVRMNSAIARDFGIDPEITVGLDCHELFWGNKETCSGCPSLLVLEDLCPHAAEFNNHRVGKTFRIKASPIFDMHNKLIGIVHVTKDITEQKRIQEELSITYAEMETKVALRTTKLKEANIKLQNEISERKHTETVLRKRELELQLKSQNVKEINIALRVMLKAREDDKKDVEERVLTNLKKLFYPYIEKLKASHLNDQQVTCLNILESNVENIISSFSQRLSSKYIDLTPREIQIANLVKDRKTNKEIADLLNVSLRTINFHRENIRNKLGLKAKKINLQSYLKSF